MEEEIREILQITNFSPVRVTKETGVPATTTAQLTGLSGAETKKRPANGLDRGENYARIIRVQTAAGEGVLVFSAECN